MPVRTPATIMDLDEIVARLEPDERFLFERVLHVSVTYGRLVPPETMIPWIERQFGSVEPVINQKIIKVTNLVTLEGVLFNRLRSSRPIWRQEIDLEAELARLNHEDPLLRPEELTPEDLFGRVRGAHSITASNVAKFDGHHGLIVFDEPHPLRFTRERIHDYIDTARRWADLAHAQDPEARYFFFLWNCLWRAGASLLHGHAQMMLGRDMHYAKVESLRRAALLYEAHHRSNYFDDLYHAHEVVGAAFEKEGVRVLASLTPIKEHEVLLIAPDLSDSLKDRTYEVLETFRDDLKISAFNLVIYMPPIEPTGENWESFPVIVRIVDRGDPTARTNDIGAMELYAASVVASDPLELARHLRKRLRA